MWKYDLVLRLSLRFRDIAPFDAYLFSLRPFICATHSLAKLIEKLVVIFESR